MCVRFVYHTATLTTLELESIPKPSSLYCSVHLNEEHFSLLVAKVPLATGVNARKYVTCVDRPTNPTYW